MPVATSQGKLRPETPRVRADLEHGVGLEAAALPASAGSAPINDPKTGRFGAANQAWRRREAKRLAASEQERGIAGLDPEKVEPWLRPFASMAIEHATSLVAGLPVQSPDLTALAGNTAAALAVFRALLALGGTGDRAALAEARAWLREHRQNTITLAALAREHLAHAPPKVFDLGAALADGDAPR